MAHVFAGRDHCACTHLNNCRLATMKADADSRTLPVLYPSRHPYRHSAPRRHEGEFLAL